MTDQQPRLGDTKLGDGPRVLKVEDRTMYYEGAVTLAWPEPTEWNDDEGFTLTWQAYSGGNVAIEFRRDELICLQDIVRQALVDTEEHWSYD